jgi:glycosyltransferase involved in cell wall biosynthesis
MNWHILDARSIWIQEFTAALHAETPAIGWIPKFGWAAIADRRVARVSSPDPRFDGLEFPLQRGYARAPVSWFAGTGSRVAAMLRAADPDAAASPLVCTTPYYAPVAERWPGPVIYYLTDLTVAYDGVDPAQVRRLDRRLCAVATLVCANSRRIAAYCVNEAGCAAGKVVVIPNATRAANIPPQPLAEPAGLPADIRDLRRPVLGVLGNLADNMDWALLEEAIRVIPDCSWAFVGPTTMPIRDEARRQTRQRVIDMSTRSGARVHFTGMRPYGQLRDYARAFDVAILPYRRHEPTFSGSCTRFYEHLAANRPMVGTRGFAELEEKVPLIALVDTAAELAGRIDDLRMHGMTDGHETTRWHASHQGTWEVRAAAMIAALAERTTTTRAVGLEVPA